MGTTDMQVLVVEDEPDIRREVAITLREDGWTVSEAANGREAWDRLRDGPRPMAIVLDILMPLMDGREFMDLLRYHPEFADIPVIQVSAGMHSSIPGVAARLDKPFAIDRLLHLLSTYARSARSEGPISRPR